MRWQRGFVIAILHLVVALPLIVLEDVASLRNLCVVEQSDGQASEEHRYGVLTPAVQVVRLTNLPASTITGWHNPHRFSVIGVMAEWHGSVHNTPTYVTGSLTLSCLVFVQWLVIGSLPVVRPKHRWLEPSVLLLACGAVGAALAWSPYTYRESPLDGFPILIALWIVVLTWVAYFALLAARALRFGWRYLRHQQPNAS